jgi:hypothetical protein
LKGALTNLPNPLLLTLSICKKASSAIENIITTQDELASIAEKE